MNTHAHFCVDVRTLTALSGRRAELECLVLYWVEHSEQLPRYGQGFHLVCWLLTQRGTRRINVSVNSTTRVHEYTCLVKT